MVYQHPILFSYIGCRGGLRLVSIQYCFPVLGAGVVCGLTASNTVFLYWVQGWFVVSQHPILFSYIECRGGLWLVSIRYYFLILGAGVVCG